MPIRLYRHQTPQQGVAIPSYPTASPDPTIARSLGTVAQAAQAFADTAARTLGRRQAYADEVTATKGMYDTLDVLDRNYRDFERNPKIESTFVDEWDKVANDIVKQSSKGMSKEAAALMNAKITPKLLEYRKKIREVSDNHLIATGLGNLVTASGRLNRLAYEAGSKPMGPLDGEVYRGVFGTQVPDGKGGFKMVGGALAEIDALVGKGLSAKDAELEKEKLILSVLGSGAEAMAMENPLDFLAAEKDPKHPRHIFIEKLPGAKRAELQRLAQRREQEILTAQRVNTNAQRADAELARNQFAAKLTSGAVTDAMQPGADIAGIIGALAKYAPHAANPVFNDTEYLSTINALKAMAEHDQKGVDDFTTVAKFVEDFDAQQRRYDLSDYTAARKRGELSDSTFKWFVGQDRANDSQRRTVENQNYTEARRENYQILSTLFGITPFTEVIGDPRHALWVEAQKKWNAGANRGQSPEALATLRADIEAEFRPHLKLKTKDQIRAIDVFLNAGPDPNIKEIHEDPRWKKMNRDQKDEVYRQLRLREKLVEYQQMLEEKAKTGPDKGQPGAGRPSSLTGGK